MGQRRHVPHVVVGTALMVAMLSVVVLPVGASRAAPTKKSPLQQGLAFYKGKTVTLISPDAPGGGFDTVSRIVAPYLQSYLGAASVVVTNDAPATTIAGQDLMAASPPDGLTIGMVNPGVDAEDVVTGSAGINFNAQKVQYLGGNTVAPVDFECNTDAGFSSFAQVVQSTKPVSEVIISTGGQTLDLDLINAAFNIHAQVIGGYASTTAELAGQEADTGNCSVIGISTPAFATYRRGGRRRF